MSCTDWQSNWFFSALVQTAAGHERLFWAVCCDARTAVQQSEMGNNNKKLNEQKTHTKTISHEKRKRNADHSTRRTTRTKLQNEKIVCAHNRTRHYTDRHKCSSENRILNRNRRALLLYMYGTVRFRFFCVLSRRLSRSPVRSLRLFWCAAYHSTPFHTHTHDSEYQRNDTTCSCSFRVCLCGDWAVRAPVCECCAMARTSNHSCRAVVFLCLKRKRTSIGDAFAVYSSRLCSHRSIAVHVCIVYRECTRQKTLVVFLGSVSFRWHEQRITLCGYGKPQLRWVGAKENEWFAVIGVGLLDIGACICVGLCCACVNQQFML